MSSWTNVDDKLDVNRNIDRLLVMLTEAIGPRCNNTYLYLKDWNTDGNVLEVGLAGSTESFNRFLFSDPPEKTFLFILLEFYRHSSVSKGYNNNVEYVKDMIKLKEVEEIAILFGVSTDKTVQLIDGLTAGKPKVHAVVKDKISALRRFEDFITNRYKAEELTFGLYIHHDIGQFEIKLGVSCSLDDEDALTPVMSYTTNFAYTELGVARLLGMIYADIEMFMSRSHTSPTAKNYSDGIKFLLTDIDEILQDWHDAVFMLPTLNKDTVKGILIKDYVDRMNECYPCSADRKTLERLSDAITNR